MQQHNVLMLHDLSCGSCLHSVFDGLLETKETTVRGDKEGKVERMVSTGLIHTVMKGFTDATEQVNLPTPQALE